jgi:mannose-6-phosphate isomerase-like protein (cupin superfamily)
MSPPKVGSYPAGSIYIKDVERCLKISARLKMSSTATTQVILPGTYTSNNPSESFETTNRGTCTWHTLFSAPQTPTDSLCAGIALCPPNTGHLCAHRHTQAEIYYIIEGSGVVVIDGVQSKVEKGSTVFIPGDAEHEIRNVGDTELRWFYVFPTGSFGDVVYRFSDEE